MRLLLCDIKRVFAGKGTVALCILAPVVVMLLFSTIIAPLFYRAQIAKFNIGICDQDKSKPVRAFVNQLVNSQALKDLVEVYPADSMQHGKDMVQNGDVLVFVYIPQNLFNDMRAQKPVVVDLLSAPHHQLEASLISMALSNSLSVVGKSENLLEEAQQVVLRCGASNEESVLFIQDSTEYAIAEFMNRRQILGYEGMLSPVGEYLPTDYYMGAIFALFAALAMIPLVRFTAADLSGAIIKRGGLCGHGTTSFYFARLFSGFLFVLLVLLMLLPTGVLLRAVNVTLRSVFSGNFAALAGAVLLSALCYSALSAAIAAWIPHGEAALWTTFYLVFLMAMVSGALLPEGYLPGWTREIGRFLPLRASMRSMVSALNVFNESQYALDMIKLGLWAVALTAIGFAGFRKKENAV